MPAEPNSIAIKKLPNNSKLKSRSNKIEKDKQSKIIMAVAQSIHLVNSRVMALSRTLKISGRTDPWPQT